MSDTNTSTIHFELVSPEEKLMSEPVTMAVVPGTEGELGIGAGHAAFVVALKAGAVTLTVGGEERKIFIAGGFADITGTQVTVLAEQAVNLSDLDQKEVEQNIVNFKEDVARAEEGVPKIRAERALALENAKLAALTGKFVA